MKLVGLSRRIALSMMAMALGAILLVVTTSYAFYSLWEQYWPDNPPTESIVPTGPEWAWLIATTLASLGLAAVLAVNLSRRILAPLNSLTEAIRRVAQGDLSARASADDRSLGEATQLVDDFNLLADKLQRMSKEQVFWNAAIAHELRTPVTILRGRLHGLAEGVFAPEEAQFRSLLLQVEGLNQLIEDLRVVSLAESGHLDVRVQQVDLGAEIRSVVGLVAASLAKAGLRPILDLQVQHACCDPARIRQALLAILENARKHAVPGTIRVLTRLDDGQFRLIVVDEGPGIAEDFLPHVFTAFRRSPQARGSGSGLGLAVVAAIAQAHGGQAKCYPSPETGTTFEMCWPHHDDLGVTEPPRAPQSPSAAEPPRD
ncbi:ATP-binding protein [Rhodoferax fermentans]|uniref:histidine kinase n=1 Tax=Rhodoferax fermentans TaxID=28066 RepID=A0A1T1ARH9_RHOFE|nr:ATP-binding protein [Rhodoferax fermentans]MBK1684765.1 sensor histidine kinase [Rhodoferax fermentans]OOV06603.1 two-component sensor histidine kinase [Rhodoferax fermentans]